jgi:predicted nuclease of predicted toxin-antitoxin system
VFSLVKFLADESCDYLIVKTLRSHNHDVIYIAETTPGISDQLVAKKALESNRMLITEDRDFSHFVFAEAQKQVGVIYLRYPYTVRKHIAKQLTELIIDKSENLTGKFMVIQPGSHRIRKLP